MYTIDKIKMTSYIEYSLKNRSNILNTDMSFILCRQVKPQKDYIQIISINMSPSAMTLKKSNMTNFILQEYQIDRGLH